MANSPSATRVLCLNDEFPARLKKVFMMVERSPLAHDGFAGRGPVWRTWFVIVAVALISAASAPSIWHGEHGTDQDCAVCQLRHQPAADLSAVFQISLVASPERFVHAQILEWVPTHHGFQIPARAPPA